jgi:hypothetical protein
MAGSIEIQKQHIKDFYQHKSQYPELAGYDEKGNYVFYAKQKQSEIGNPKQITKTIPPIVYRKKTPEELQVEDQTYATNVQSAIEKYTAKRMELFTEATKIGADNKVLHKLNMELAEIDKILISERYAHYHIQPYNRFESKINMRDIFFENTVEDRRVDDNLSIVETRRYPVQREFTPVNEFVSLAEANKMIEPLEEKVQEAVNATLQAKSAAVTPVVKGISKIKKQSVKTEVPPVLTAATTAPSAVSSVVTPTITTTPPVASPVLTTEPAVTVAPAVVAPPTATAAVTAAPAVVAPPTAPAVVASVKGVPKLGPLRNISVVKKPAVAAAEP